MDAEEFVLKWNDHQSNVLSMFHELCVAEQLVDVSLACEDHMFKAHKLVLSACSPYFRKLFLRNPCKHPIIFLKDVNSEHIKHLLWFMYQGEISVGQNELVQLLQTARSLQISGLTEVTSVQGKEEDEENVNEKNLIKHNVAKRSSSPEVQSIYNETKITDHLDVSQSESLDVRDERGTSGSRSFSACPSFPSAGSEVHHANSKSQLSDVRNNHPVNSWFRTDVTSTSSSSCTSNTAVVARVRNKNPGECDVVAVRAVKIEPGEESVTDDSQQEAQHPQDISDLHMEWHSVIPEPPVKLSEAETTESAVHFNVPKYPRGFLRLENTLRTQFGVTPGLAKQETHKTVKQKTAIAMPLPSNTPGSSICSLCGKLIRKQRFYLHRRVHSGLKPFGCNLCPKGFAQKSDLQKHLVTHTRKNMSNLDNLQNSSVNNVIIQEPMLIHGN